LSTVGLGPTLPERGQITSSSGNKRTRSKQSEPVFECFRAGIHIGSLSPLVAVVWDMVFGRLSVNPIHEITVRTGKPALVLLVLTLACTPINSILGFRNALRVRRTLGLYAFLYACVHFVVFLGLDYGFNPFLLREAVLEKPYALVGFGAFLTLVPLAITSSRTWMIRLGRRWKLLHRLVYLTGVLVVVHYVWLVKSDIRQPLAFGAAIGLLLLLRLPVIGRTARRMRILFRGWVV